MAELIAHNTQRAELESSGYIGEPTGETILRENHTTNDVKEFATAKVEVPDPILIDKEITENGTYSAQTYNADGFREVDVDVQPNLIDKDISKNGTYKASDEGADGFREVNVNLPFEQKTVTPSATQQTVTPSEGFEALESVTVEATPLESKTVTPTTEQQTIIPKAPAIGFSEVTVEPVTPPPVLIEKTITENGIYTAEEDNADGYSEVEVDIPTPTFESKTATPTAIQFDVEPSVGFDGLSKVTILAALFGIDVESLSHFEFGIDDEGLYYTDEVGGGTPVYMGVDARGLYVIGGNTNA